MLLDVLDDMPNVLLEDLEVLDEAELTLEIEEDDEFEDFDDDNEERLAELFEDDLLLFEDDIDDFDDQDDGDIV